MCDSRKEKGVIWRDWPEMSPAAPVPGMNSTLRDAGRFGQMLLSDGCAADGSRVVPAAWLDEIFSGADSDRTFATFTPVYMKGKSQSWIWGDFLKLCFCSFLFRQKVHCSLDS